MKSEDREWKKKYDEKMNVWFSSSAYKKLENYYSEILEKDYLSKKIIGLRKKFGIPVDGYKVKHFIFPPRQLARENTEFISKVLNRVCHKYGLNPFDWTEALESYLYYNVKEVPQYTTAWSLCLLSDLADEASEPFGKFIRDSDNKYFPIAIRLSPHVSERDIIDFVKKNYTKNIQPLLNMYKSDYPIERVRTKNPITGKRNSFIYENRKLSLKKISELVKDKFNEDLDVGHIGKIISILKKRKKV